MLDARRRGGRGDVRRLVVSGAMEGDTVAMVVQNDMTMPPLIWFNVRLVSPEVTGLYGRALAWAETHALVCNDPFCVLRLSDL